MAKFIELQIAGGQKILVNIDNIAHISVDNKDAEKTIVNFISGPQDWIKFDINYSALKNILQSK